MTRLVVFTLAWAAGILLAQADFFHPVWFLLLIPTMFVFHVGWKQEKWAPKVMFIMAGILSGAARLLLAQPVITPDHVAFYNDMGHEQNRITLEGVIRKEPDRRVYLTNLYLDVDIITFPSGEARAVHGWVLLKAPPYSDVFYGDHIVVNGMLETPPDFEGFSYGDYLARHNIHALLRDADVTVLDSHQANRLWETLLRFKNHAHSTLLSILPEPQASLLSGILLGIETGIPEDLDEAFVATGTSHIVAISGFNLSVIAQFLVSAARKTTKGRGVVPLALGGVWLYTLFVGASPAVVRAAVMATVTIVANHHVRAGRVHGPTSLATAALFMLVANPYTLWDVGFQLSVMATLGLILYTVPLTHSFKWVLDHWFESDKVQIFLSLLSDALIVTLAAQVTTTGILVGTFHRLSLVTLLTNFLILPVQNFVMAFGMAALIVALLIPPLGQVFALLAWPFLAWTTTCVQWTANFPLASIELGSGALPLVWASYGLLFVVTWWFKQTKEERCCWLATIRRQELWKFVTGLGVLVAFFVCLFYLPDRRLHVRFLDVGLGDAIFIQTPDNCQILIDGGPDPSRTLSALGRVMPFWDRSLDMVILTAPEEERVAGLIPIVERYTVSTVIQGFDTEEGSVFEHWSELVRARSPETTGTLWNGTSLSLSDEVVLYALWPDAGDDGPLVLRLTYGDTQILLMGAATTLVEETLVARYGHDLQSSVLLIARHGAKTSTSAAFLQMVEPQIAIITTDGDDERYPSPTVLARLVDVDVYLTAESGTIEIVSDGYAVRVNPECVP